MKNLKQSYSEVIDFDEIDNVELLSTKYQSKPSKSNKPDLQEYKGTMEEEDKKLKGLSKDPLMSDARNKLNYYLKKIPNYKTTTTQIELLQKEMNQYKKSGDTKNYEACVEMIRTLKDKVKEIKSVFATTEGVKAREKRIANLAKINESTKIKELKEKEEKIKSSMSTFSPSKMVNDLSHYRKLLKYQESQDEIVDFEDMFESNENWDGYYELLNRISEITGLEENDIKSMSLLSITEALKDNVDLESFNEELRVVRAEIQAEKDNINGAMSLSNIINEIYDIKTEESLDIPKAKEILASAHVQMVKNIAYGICYSDKSGKNMRYYDDCVSAGLLALTGVINNWIKLQQTYGANLSFKGWARVNVTNAIKREFWSQQSGGRISGSRWADMMSRENKKIDKFLETYPQYKEFDKDFVKSLVNGIYAGDGKITSTDDLKPIVMESDIYNGAEDGEGADLWANVTSKSIDSNDLIESGSEYQELIKSISKLMKKLNKYERKLFMLYYGFEKKMEHLNGETDSKRVNTNYTQKEIGQILYDFYLENGASMRAVNGSFSQPAINDKINKLEKKIAQEIKNNPSLKQGFDYLFTYWINNTEMLNLLSDNRDEVGMKLERDSYYNNIDDYTEEEQALYFDRQLTDGKTLRDKFELSDSNMFGNNDVIDEFYRIAEED